MRGPGHFGSGDVLAKGRHEQIPQASEKVRQSASVAHAVEVAGSALGCAALGDAAPSARECDGAMGAPGGTITGLAPVDVVDGEGEESRSLRTHATAKSIVTSVNGVAETDMAAAYRDVTGRASACRSPFRSANGRFTFRKRSPPPTHACGGTFPIMSGPFTFDGRE